METNKIALGDCLDELKKIKDMSVDLIYIDPPFFSKRNYKTNFKGNGEIRSFDDVWDKMSDYTDFIGERLMECKRILKDSGSLYLHCDWHASHYLKIELDRIFGVNNFRNEIVWHYRTGGVSKNWFSRKHDVIFLYTKSKKHFFKPIEVKEYYKDIYGSKFKPGWEDRKGGTDLGGDYHFVYMDDVWDIPAVFNMSDESAGYPTQKPEALLQRIISASSKEGQIILDPFCGSGTTLVVAEREKRQWIGIDKSLTACEIAKKRLQKVGVSTEIIGAPSKENEIKNLDTIEFKNWVVRKINFTIKKSKSDKIDGIIFERTPIKIERKEDIGDKEMIEFGNSIKKEGMKEGIYLGLSFSENARREINTIKLNYGIKIKTITLKDLLENNLTVW
jgi:DNA modification methylase